MKRQAIRLICVQHSYLAFQHVLKIWPHPLNRWRVDRLDLSQQPITVRVVEVLIEWAVRI